VLALAAVYGGLLIELAKDWIRDDNYSHGFLVLPAAAYMTWQRRAVLRDLPVAPSLSGIAVVGGGLVLLLIGTAGIELFLTRVSIVVVLGGSVLFLFGPSHLRAVAFPLAFLLLMIPLPALIFNQIAFPLQLLASQFGVEVLQGFGIPVLREGNVIVLANTTLEVAEACSGIRSLISLVTLTLLYSYISGHRTAFRAVIVLAAVPIVVLTNGLRVATSGLATHYYGPGMQDGRLHDLTGLIVFVVSFAMIVAVERLLARTLSPFVTIRASEWQATRA
jgi:exosortase